MDDPFPPLPFVCSVPASRGKGPAATGRWAIVAPVPPTILEPNAWRARIAAHEARVNGWIGPHLQRRRRGEKHPVFDFLFTYYSHRPAQLRRWHPGAGVVLAGADPRWFGHHYVAAESAGAAVDTEAVLARRRGSFVWIQRMLAATAARPAHFGCFGMHEWAMVYRQSQAELRHNSWPLRLGRDRTSALVDELRIRCSHFDAFRFFTPAARPLNALQPTRDTQPDHEQPGCLHANMDTYRWAYKLSPLVSSELVADCFDLAREIRTVDMRASPYDLSVLGFRPIPVETPEGRAEYVNYQRDFSERGAVLRARLLAACAALLGREETELLQLDEDDVGVGGTDVLADVGLSG